MRISVTIMATIAAIGLTTNSAAAFEFTFNWGNLKLCTSGQPNVVNNPTFKLSDVPQGTKYIVFKLVDHNARGYNHGGGKVKYTGGSTIKPGAFTYKSPCPPNGTHTYEWTATAQKKKNGGKLARAKSAQKYP